MTWNDQGETNPAAKLPLVSSSVLATPSADAEEDPSSAFPVSAEKPANQTLPA